MNGAQSKTHILLALGAVIKRWVRIVAEVAQFGLDGGGKLLEGAAFESLLVDRACYIRYGTIQAKRTKPVAAGQHPAIKEE